MVMLELGKGRSPYTFDRRRRRGPRAGPCGKAQQAVLHRRRQKARYYGCLPLPISPSVRAQGIPKATLVGDFLGPGHRGRRFSSRSPEGGPETIYPDGLLGRGTAEPIGVDLLLGPASLAQELLVHQLPARESLRLALE